MRLIGPSARTTRDTLRDQLVDAYIESYVDWREACHDLRDAYQRWVQAAPVERDLAFVACRAALDREENAALLLEREANQLARQAQRRPPQAR
jgi:hypothetical protein